RPDEHQGDVLRVVIVVFVAPGEPAERNPERRNEGTEKVTGVPVERAERRAVAPDVVGTAAPREDSTEHDEPPRLVERVVQHEGRGEPTRLLGDAQPELLLLREIGAAVARVARPGGEADRQREGRVVDRAEATGDERLDVTDAGVRQIYRAIGDVE